MTGRAAPLIAVDIDDVLSNNAAEFVAFSNERWGTNLTVADYDEHWGELWQTDTAETERRALDFLGSGTMGRYGHDEAASPVLRHLSRTYRLVVVTSRRLMVQPETAAWLDARFDGIFENVHYAGMWDDPTEHSIHMTKVDVLDRIGADYLVDDQLKHVKAAAGHGLQAVLFGSYPWNQAERLPDGVTRVSDWHGVKEFFDGRSAPR